MYKVLEKTSPGRDEMRAVYVERMIELAGKNKDIVLLDADLMRAMNIFPYAKAHPDQIVDCGIMEGHMYSLAAGLSAVGKIPFPHTMACFASRRGFDQIYISCAYANFNAKIIASDPGICTEINGGTHMAFCDVAIMRGIPNITIIEPTDSVMLEDLLGQISEIYGMFYVRLYRKKVPQIYEEGSTFTIGKAAKVRDGSDVSIIASGMMVAEAAEAAKKLEQEGIYARIYDMFTVKPLDCDTVIQAAKETGAIVTAENHCINGGLGSAVSEVIAENILVPLKRVGLSDEFGEVGPLSYLKERFHITSEDICKACRDVVARKKNSSQKVTIGCDR